MVIWNQRSHHSPPRTYYNTKHFLHERRGCFSWYLQRVSMKRAILRLGTGSRDITFLAHAPLRSSSCKNLLLLPAQFIRWSWKQKHISRDLFLGDDLKKNILKSPASNVTSGFQETLSSLGPGLKIKDQITIYNPSATCQLQVSRVLPDKTDERHPL